jgi:DNA gyrase subunit B
LTRAVNQYARRAGLIGADDVNLSGSDVRAGLTAVVSVRMYCPVLELATKTRLSNREVAGMVGALTNRYVWNYLTTSPDIGQAIVTRLISNVRREHAADE